MAAALKNPAVSIDLWIGIEVLKQGLSNKVSLIKIFNRIIIRLVLLKFTTVEKTKY